MFKISEPFKLDQRAGAKTTSIVQRKFKKVETVARIRLIQLLLLLPLVVVVNQLATLHDNIGTVTLLQPLS